MRDVLLGFGAAAGYGVLHSILASEGAKRAAKRVFGRLGEVGYRLAYNSLSALTLVPILWLLALSPGAVLYSIAWPWIALSTALQIAGAVLVLAGLKEVGLLRFLGLRPLRAGANDSEDDLTASGVYRLIRNPLYVGGLMVLWFSPLMTSSLLGVNIGLTLYTLVGARLEARRMRSAFGEAYAAYEKAVPAFLPRLKRK